LYSANMKCNTFECQEEGRLCYCRNFSVRGFLWLSHLLHSMYKKQRSHGNVMVLPKMWNSIPSMDMKCHIPEESYNFQSKLF